MVQVEEATQVAMKHAISDFQKEAVAQDAMSSPSLVVLTITVNTVNHDVATLESLARYLYGVARKSLLAQFKPLSQDSLLEPTNLSAWWQQVKSVVVTLDINFLG